MNDKRNAYSRNYYHTVTKLRNPNYNAERSQRYRKANPEKRLWSIAKERAKKKGLEFTIDPEDVIIPKICPLLGIELRTDTTMKTVQHAASIDRIDPTLGYVKGNVRVISYKANAMKNDATQKELVTFAKAILNEASVHWNTLDD